MKMTRLRLKFLLPDVEAQRYYEGRSQPGEQKLGPWAAARARQLGLCKRARASADRNGAWINKVGIELNRVGVRVNRERVCKQGYSLHKQGRN